MGKRIRINGVLYEAVQPRRSRNLNESSVAFTRDRYNRHQYEADFDLPYGYVTAYIFDDEGYGAELNITVEDKGFCFVGPLDEFTKELEDVVKSEGKRIIKRINATNSIRDLIQVARFYGLKKQTL